jgi:hypothetical protein
MAVSWKGKPQVIALPDMAPDINIHKKNSAAGISRRAGHHDDYAKHDSPQAKRDAAALERFRRSAQG